MNETSDFIAKCEAFAREFPAATLSEGDPTEEVEGASSADGHTRLNAHRRMKLIARQRIDQILASDFAATSAAIARAEEEQRNALNRETLDRLTGSILGFTKDAVAETAVGCASVEPAPAEASAVIQGVQRVTRIIELIEAEIGPLSGPNSSKATRALLDTVLQVFGVERLRQSLGL